MQDERNQATGHLALTGATNTSRPAATVWRRLPAVAKCIIVVPVAMAMLGAEIELRISPQLDLFLTAAGVWGMSTWLRN